MPGPELIASGTKSTPQLLTFGTITGSPSAGGGASKPAASSTKAVAPASSTAVLAPASSSAVAGAVTTPAANSTVEPTPSAAPIVSSSAAPALTSAVLSNSTSTTATLPPSTLATSVRPQPTQGGSSGAIKEYAQCGGQGFQGAGSCASGLECKQWNPYYFQCIKSEGGASSPTTTEAAPAPSAPAQSPSAPSASAPAAEPVVVAPTNDEPKEKTYTLETFIAFLEKNAGSAQAAKIRRMIEALQ
jgi:cellulase